MYLHKYSVFDNNIQIFLTRRNIFGDEVVKVWEGQ